MSELERTLQKLQKQEESVYKEAENMLRVMNTMIVQMKASRKEIKKLCTLLSKELKIKIPVLQTTTKKKQARKRVSRAKTRNEDLEILDI